ncbi:transcription activator acu-15 [Fusarium denticulatum]|uniref:Transcription activator acu-15 n=1 Tax=Fusarium denticulatum TaxID=48507 RepID=A0A8H5XKC9_9HYPO|nr:transcription activator acu-15 [Fusarium denticulatum]
MPMELCAWEDPLIVAAVNGNTKELGKQLDVGRSVDARDLQNGRTLLIWATLGGHADAVDLLLRRSANPHSQDLRNRTALLHAVANGYEAITGRLITAGAKIDTIDDAGYTALMLATISGSSNLVERLLMLGANVDTKEWRHEKNPLLYAAEHGFETCVDLLLNAGAEVDFVDKSGRTPLSWAAGHGHANIVSLLLQKGANPDMRDNDLERTPFLWSIKNEQIAAIKILKEKSPPELGYGLMPRPVPATSPRLEEIQQRYKAVKPDFDWSKTSGGDLLLWALGCQDGIEEDDITFLIEQGADVNVKKEDGTSVLCQACWSGYGKVVSLLIEKGVDPNCADTDGRTPLASAAGAGHKEIVQNLLDHDVDIDPVDEEEMTPMLMAACCGHSEIVLMLLEKGANANAHDINGYHALSFASESGDLGFVRALVDKGALPDEGMECSALMNAVATNHMDMVKFLIKHGATSYSDSYDICERPPLVLAASHGKIEIMKLFLDMSSDNPETKIRQIWRALVEACDEGEAEAVKLLLKYKPFDCKECLVEDPATGLFRPRDYMQSLETRVAYLEGLLQQARPDVALDHLMGLEKDSSSFSPSAATPFVGPTESEPAGNRQRDVSAEAEDARDQLSTDVALLCLTTASKEPHYFGPSSAVSFSRIIGTAIDLPKRSQASTIRFEHAGFLDWNCPQPFPISFPSPPLGTALSQAYFGNIHAQYPFLHEPTFRFWEEQCFKADLSGNLSAAGDMAQFFVWMVYATASLALGPAHYDTAESYYKMALKHQPAILELDSIESIQSLLSDVFGSPKISIVWRPSSSVAPSVYQMTVLMLRHWITHKALDGEEDSVEEALKCCTQKAKELCLLYRRLFQYQSLQFTWGSLHILFLGGLTYLYCIWKSSRVRQAAKRMDIINTCMACNTALVIIAERWSKAVPYRDIFEVLSERTISLVCGDGSLSRGTNEASQTSDQNQSADPRAVEDWSLDIVADDMPVDSEWFVQELLQGMSNNEA